MITNVSSWCGTESWLKTAAALLLAPLTESRAGPTREILGWQSRISDPSCSWFERSGASIGYGFAELLWYLRGDRRTEMLEAYAPGYARFTNDGEAKGAYGHRWKQQLGYTAGGGGLGQLWDALELLRKRGEDRRAVVTMWDSGDLIEAGAGVWKDIPCTLSLQFLLRAGKLSLVATMRSNDLWLGGLYDPFCFCELLRLMAAALEADVGEYIHQVGSMHLYTKDEGRIMETVAAGWASGQFRTPSPRKDEAERLLRMDGSSGLIGTEEKLRDAFTAGAGGIGGDGLGIWETFALDRMAEHLTRQGKKGSGRPLGGSTGASVA